MMYEYIHALCGISLDDSKSYLVEGRLGGLANSAGCDSFRRLLQCARNDSSRALERRIVDAITTNETLFFRDGTPFDLLRQKLIPELVDLKKRRGQDQLRIWSAACSTGQELYSIAILLKELLGDPDRYGVHLCGSDISNAAVASASRGVYGDVEIGRGLNDQMRSKYFKPHVGGWQIRDQIRAMASFRQLNLLRDFTFMGKFDIIFCRNVAIYFNDADRRQLFDRIERSLEPHGSLVIGSMESLNGIAPRLEAKRHLRAVYYQLKGEGVNAPV